MNGPVTWEVLQWIIGGGIVLLLAGVGGGGGAMIWLQSEFKKIRHSGDNRTTAVLNTVEGRFDDIEKKMDASQDQARQGLDALRTEMNSRFITLTGETHENNAKLRERVATVETIVARLPR